MVPGAGFEPALPRLSTACLLPRLGYPGVIAPHSRRLVSSTQGPRVTEWLHGFPVSPVRDEFGSSGEIRTRNLLVLSEAPRTDWATEPCKLVSVGGIEPLAATRKIIGSGFTDRLREQRSCGALAPAFDIPVAKEKPVARRRVLGSGCGLVSLQMLLNPRLRPS